MGNDKVSLRLRVLISIHCRDFSNDLDRDWRDPKWTSAKSVANGLETPTREQRHVLMGDNIIDIAGKSVFGLLLDEVGLN